jgi:transposase InsO family protein
MIQITGGAEVQPMKINIESRPAYCLTVEKVQDDKPWYHDIKTFLQEGKYPEMASKNDQRTLRRLASHFLLSGSILYKRSSNTTLLRCVDKDEARELMKEVHEGVCGPHMNGYMLARKIMRLGYYWLTMESDCIKYVKHYHLCQVYANRINAPPNELHLLSAPWPFSMWGIDIIGPITPTASNGHRFILVAIDYFTKWVEASSYTNVTKGVIVRFLKRDIIARYGVPESIITDNGTNLNNKSMTGLCQQFHINHRNSTPYRPQMNGAVEAANKNIKKIIEKMTTTYKDWHEMLPFALMAYRTSIRTSTGATPYSLVYGTEAVLPVEVEIPSFRILSETQLAESDWVRKRLDQLNLIDERRLTALCHGQCYQQRMARAFNKTTRPRYFKEGDLVLRKVLPNA